MEFFIHVGAPKTATTALQQHVFPNLSDTLYVRYLQAELVYGNWSGYRNVLWSYEDLSGTPSLNRREIVDNRFTIADNLALLFPSASIILGTREPQAWLRSLYKESVRQGSPLDFDSFRRRIDDKYLDWVLYENFLRERFPRVLTYTYERFREAPDAVAQDICSFMGVTLTSQPTFAMENESVSDRRLRFLRRANRWVKSETYNPDGVVPARYMRPFSGIWRRQS